MSIAATIRTIIADSPDVIAIAGDRICVDFIPEDSIMPAALLYIIHEESFDCLSGFVGLENAKIRIECYGQTRAEADGLHKVIRSSLNGIIGEHYGTMIKGISQASGRIYLVDKPNDGTDNWLFKTIQTFEVTYNSF
jgi:hypothetical protein